MIWVKLSLYLNTRKKIDKSQELVLGPYTSLAFSEADEFRGIGLDGKSEVIYLYEVEYDYYDASGVMMVKYIDNEEWRVQTVEITAE